MLPFPIYYRSVNCSGLTDQQFDAPLVSGLNASLNISDVGWSTCPQLRNQAYTFLVFSCAILCLSLASMFVESNRRTEPAVASMVSSMLLAETVIAVCLLADSLAFLGLGLCRNFPTVNLSPILSLAIGLNQWLASVCLFYRNWLVALISLTRYRVFSRNGGGGGVGGGGHHRGSVVSHRVRAEQASLRQFRLASCLLLGNAGLFCAFLSLKTVGEVCLDQSWLVGPVMVDRFLLAINNASLFLAVNTGVVFPLQVVLPLVIGLASSGAVLITLYRHIQQQSVRSNRKRYRRPFVAFLAMNIALIVLYLPTVLIRVLVLLNYALNDLFWISNILCCTNSLTNVFVYFYLCKACGNQQQQQRVRQQQQLQPPLQLLNLPSEHPELGGSQSLLGASNVE